MKSETLGALAKALAAAQGEFPTVAKDASNPFFKSKYADLATVIKTASPVLSKHGLAISQFVTGDGANHYLATYLLHTSGEYIAHDMELLLSKADAQGQGSAITYARRYSYMSVLGLVADEDDDGNAASKLKAAYPAKPVQYGHINTDQAKELMALAKAMGFDTRDKASEYLNSKTGLTDWTTLPVNRFEKVKQDIQLALPAEDGDPFFKDMD